MNKFIIQMFFISTLLSVMSCSFFEKPEIAPYVISKLECKMGMLEGYYSFGCVQFDFFNASNKDVSEILVSCIVYDTKTKKNPFIGTNFLKNSFSGNIIRQENKTLILSLDQYIFVVPDEPYLIDFFSISKIIYIDGTSWEDKNGFYFTRSF